ncbi:MAG: DUF2029 domain-containing protein [Acidobacteria bacterium]|nr:DUF2029 domain-containing protein [Acidobacteriota bacterium]
MAVAAAVLAAVVAAYEPHTFLRGDCPYYAAAALSLLEDGDFDLRDQIWGGLDVHATQVALGARGEWFPKHPLLMPIATVPFLALFGLDGALYFNCITVLLLFAALARLGGRFTSREAGLLAALLILFGTFLPAYFYNYSPDLFGSLLVTAGFLALFAGGTRTAGATLAAAAWAKPTNAVFFLGAVAYAGLRRGWRAAAACILGGAPIFALVGLLQFHMFGAPWRTGYDRTLVLAGGTVWLVTHRDFFDYPFWRGMREQLFFPGRGLLITAPPLWLALPGSVLFWRKRRPEAALLLATCTMLFLLLCRYRFWALSHAGNRFLLPLICLAVLPLSFVLDRLRARPAGRGPREAGT